MKISIQKSKLCNYMYIQLFILCFINLSFVPDEKVSTKKSKKEYHVAAYVWPSCHNSERVSEKVWPQGKGEWEVIQKGIPLFEGHYQPRLPLWGYEMDNNPVVMEKWIDVATDHGVNVFIFDWYWYEGKPFLEETLDDGFLKAKNNEKMQFYIMWANHDLHSGMINPHIYKTDSILWTGDVDWENFKIVVDRVINQYFKKTNYFKISGKPVISIFSLENLVNSFHSIEKTRMAIDYFREEVKKAGFPGLHFQGIGVGSPVRLLSEKNANGRGINEIASALDLNSVTMYNGAVDLNFEDYMKYCESGLKLRKELDSLLSIPFFPVVSVGWDNSPRYPKMGKSAIIHKNITPESFAAYLQRAKNYADEHPEQPKLIIINAWNEWIEGSYLLPDMKYGFGYLKAVNEVINDIYDPYSKTFN